LLNSRLFVRAQGFTFRDAFAYLYTRKVTIAKFVASGSTAAAVEFSLLYVLKEYAGLHYLISSSIAFCVAVVVGFTLQKFWTFENRELDRIQRQAIQYFALGLTNLGINAVLMYLLVENFHLWYMLAQVLACGMLACNNFLMYNLFIFKPEAENLDELGE